MNTTGKISVVIPTMWRYSPFVDFVQKVADHPLVSEVIVFDNDYSSRPYEDPFDRHDVKLINTDKNNFVNPSWNMGIERAENDFICVLNDDVVFDLRVFDEIVPYMYNDDFGVAGAHPGELHLHQKPFVNGLIDIVPWESPLPGQSEGYLFGFGTLFFVKKSKWIPIPEKLSVYYGDDWVHLTQDTFDRKIYLITNFFYHSPSAQTCTSIFSEDQRNYILREEGEIYKQEVAIFRDKTYQEYIEGEYNLACTIKTDINEHIPILRQLASECERVVELGVREGWSTRAFLTQRNRLRSYDIILWPYVAHLFKTMQNIGRDFQYIQASSLDIELDDCDMIFFDTEHTYKQLNEELKLHGNKASKYLVFHDTVSFGHELMPAIQVFMDKNPQWVIKDEYTNNNGLLILERIND